MIKRRDLLEKELTYMQNPKPFKPSNRNLDKIFNHYDIHEFTEHWYDTDKEDPLLGGRPPIEFNNWVDIWGPGIWYMNQNQVNKFAKNSMKNLKKKYEIKNRWYIGDFYIYKPVELYAKNKKGIILAKFIKTKKEKKLCIYFYGRDIIQEDCWFLFERKDK